MASIRNEIARSDSQFLIPQSPHCAGDRTDAGSSPTRRTAWVVVVTPPPQTLHPTPYTAHPIPYTLHPTPYTRHLTPYTLHPTQWRSAKEALMDGKKFIESLKRTVLPNPSNPVHSTDTLSCQLTPYLLHPTPYSRHLTPYTLHPTP